MGRYQDWQWATETLATARNEANGKPVQNNTRLYRRSDDSIAVKLHAVDVVTINRDGTWTLRANGWHTVTTMERIRGYSPAQLFSERGDWYLRLEPDAADPRPVHINRTVPKPFTATDPGAEPVKGDEDCIAGQMITTEHVNEVVEVWRKDMLDSDELVEVVRESTVTTDGQYDKVTVKRTWNSHVWVGSGGQAWQDDEWASLPGNHARHSSNFTNADNETVSYIQCVHCKEFDVEHERWRMRMHGNRWGVRFDGRTDYSTYRAMMDTYGTAEAWQDAYLADYRARMAYLKADKEWDIRNRVPFYDGVTVDADGFAPRERKGGPSAAKLRKHEAAVKRMKARIDKYADGYIKELQKGTMPMPGGGDCWFCSLFAGEGSDGHLIDHMSEKYYVPSLAVNALRERGYQDAGIYMWLDMNPEAGTMGKPGGRYDGVKRDITTYMRKRLVPQAPTK